MKKRAVRLVLSLLAIVIALMTCASAMAEKARSPLAIDMVIVIENSYRMQRKGQSGHTGLDTEGLRFDAAAALISMCDVEYSRATYFLFANDLYVYDGTIGRNGNTRSASADEFSLSDISFTKKQENMRKSIMSDLTGKDIRTGYGTYNGSNLGVALEAAVDIQLRSKENGNRKVILLLTGGSGKQTKDSEDKARAARKTAEENGIEIYAVALKDNTSTALLEELVSKSENFQFANRPEDIVRVYRNIYATMIGSKIEDAESEPLGEKQYKIDLPIPNKSVSEVNIVLDIKGVSDLVLRDPNGKQISESDDNTLINRSNNFEFIKLISPEDKTYQLVFTAAEEKKYSIQYVFSYGVDVQADVNAAKINKHEPVTITAKYTENGFPKENDPRLYEIPATVTLRKDDRIIALNKPMEHDDREYHLTFTDLEKEGAGVYTATIHFEGDGMMRDSELTFELINNPPKLKSASVSGAEYEAVINIPNETASYDPETRKKTWDLNDFVTDINTGDTLTAEIRSETVEANIALEGMKLTVTPIRDTATEGDIRVVVLDNDKGESPELVFHIKFENFEAKYDTYTASFDPVKGQKKKMPCAVTLRLFDAAGNEIRQDDQVPDRIIATVTENGASPADVLLTKEGGRWTGSFDTGDHAAKYKITAKIPVGQKTIIAKEEEIVSENTAPELVSPSATGESFEVTINYPRIEDSYIPEKNGRTWDLNTFVTDTDKDGLVPEITAKTADVYAVLDGMNLTIRPNRNTAASGEVQVVVRDNDNAESPRLVFPVTVNNYELRYENYTAHFDPVRGIEKNSACEVVLRLYDEEGTEVRQDDQLPDEVLASVAEPGAQPSDLLLTREGSHWKGSFATGAKSTDYTVSAEITIGQKTVTAEKKVISSENKAPSLKDGAKANQTWSLTINDPSDSETYKAQQKSWTLTDLVEDLNGDDITFEVDRDASTADVNASVNNKDKTLTITTKLNTETEGDVVVTSKDNDDLSGPKLTVHIKVTNKEAKYKLYTAELEPDGKGKNKDITFTLSVMDEKGMLVKGDSNLPDLIEAEYTLQNEKTTFPLERGENGKWTGSFRTVDKEAVYTVTAAVRISDNVSILADHTLSTVNTVPKVIRELNTAEEIPAVIRIEPFLLWNDATGDVVIPDLNEFFKDEDGDKLTFRVDGQFGADLAEAEIEGSKLTIRGRAESAEPLSFTVTATDNEQQEATSQPVSFTVKSLQKQGIITLAIAAAAIILLLIIIHAVKPKYPNAAFSVSVNGVPFGNGNQLPKGGMAKKAVNLQGYAPSMAKTEYGMAIHTALSSVILKPGYSKTVKIDAGKATGINVKINGKDQRKGSLSNNGKLTISKDDKQVVFELAVTGGTAARKNKPAKPSPTKPAGRTSGGTGSGSATGGHTSSGTRPSSGART